MLSIDNKILRTYIKVGKYEKIKYIYVVKETLQWIYTCRGSCDTGAIVNAKSPIVELLQPPK